jgi:hypothetical protein
MLICFCMVPYECGMCCKQFRGTCFPHLQGRKVSQLEMFHDMGKGELEQVALMMGGTVLRLRSVRGRMVPGNRHKIQQI